MLKSTYHFPRRLTVLRSSREWWQKAIKNSRTGAFSFWIGKHHIIGLSGESARKMFMDMHDDKFDSNNPQVLRPLGPYFMPPVPEIFHPGFHNGRNYFVRRLMELQKTERLTRYLGRMTGDCRKIFAALPAENPAGFTNPHDPAWRTVFSQACRLIYMDEVADDPKQLSVYRDIVEVFLTTFSLFNVPWPWLPAPSAFKRSRNRRALEKLVQGRIDERLAKGCPRRDDGLQHLVDSGDRKDYMLDFYVGGLFIITANARMLTGQMLHIMATRPDWQARVYAEVEAAAAKHSENKDPSATLVDKLDAMPLGAWETSFPSLQICYSEAIRMWVAFHMVRQNISRDPIPIPGTDQVIPPGSFVALNTMEVHFNPDLYENPGKYDPERWLEGRDHSKGQIYGCRWLTSSPSQIDIVPQSPLLSVPCGLCGPLSQRLGPKIMCRPLTMLCDPYSPWVGWWFAPLHGYALGQDTAEHHDRVRPRHVRVEELRRERGGERQDPAHQGPRVRAAYPDARRPRTVHPQKQGLRMSHRSAMLLWRENRRRERR